MVKKTTRAKSDSIKGFHGLLVMLAITTGIIALGCSTSKSTADADDEYVVKITTIEQFNDVVLQAEKPVLVDFYATWCGACQRLAPIIHELAKEYEGRVVFVKVNVDEVTELTIKYKISLLPDVRIFNQGKEIRGPVIYDDLRGTGGFFMIGENR